MKSFIGEYRKKLDNQQVFTCYRSSVHLGEVVPKIKYTSSDTLHAMLWPTLLLVGSILSAYCLYYDSCHLYMRLSLRDHMSSKQKTNRTQNPKSRLQFMKKMRKEPKEERASEEMKEFV